MNKYEKALADVANETVDRLADGYYQPKTVEHFHSSAINILRELVERATPKEPLIAFADGVTADGSIVQKTALVCPSCKSLLVERQKYCHFCGQAIDWRVEDE